MGFAADLDQIDVLNSARPSFSRYFTEDYSEACLQHSCFQHLGLPSLALHGGVLEHDP